MLRNKRQTQQTFRYVFFIVLLVIFFATVGVKLLINTSIFVSQYSRKQEDVGGPIDVLAPAQLYDIPDATNSAQLDVAGSATRGTEVVLYVNDEQQDSLTLTEDEFTFTAQLNQGDNTIYVETKDPKTRKVRDSDTYSVTFTAEKPTLTITYPTDGVIVDTESLVVTGSTAPGASAQINNSPVVVDNEGSFSHKVPLQSGENVLVITSSDRAGNSDRVELRVRREN